VSVEPGGPLLALGHLLTVSALTLTGWIVMNRPEQPGKRPYLLIQAILLLFFARNVTFDLGIYPTITIVDAINNSLYQMSLVLFGSFAFLYTGRGITVTRRVQQIFGVLMLCCLSITVNFLATGPLEAINRVIFIFTFALSTPIFMYGVYIFLRTGIVDETLSRTGSGVLAGVGLALLLISPLTNVLPRWSTMLIGNLFAVCFLLLQLHYRIFQGPPAMGYLAREPVFNAMDEAIVAVDREGHLTDANERARRTFNIELSEAVGRPLEAVLGYEPEADVGKAVELDTVDGVRSFVVSSSPIDSEDGSPIGCTFIFRDVTDEQTREQQLEVFNRVLRHNLRNDLDAIRGFAESLETTDADGPFDTTTVAERIHSLSMDLSKTGKTAKRAEQIRTKERLVRETLSVDRFLESITERIEQQLPECALVTHTPPQPEELETDPEILETVLLEVVENAIVHTADPKPAVEIGVELTDDGVRFAVRDEGEGIPDRERAVLREGEPTQLQHGSGIGLWLVSWGVTRLGGDLSFEHPETGGTIVRLSIPDQGSTAPVNSSQIRPPVGLQN
jgi:signal transduction histidine kinase